MKPERGTLNPSSDSTTAEVRTLHEIVGINRVCLRPIRD